MDARHAGKGSALTGDAKMALSRNQLIVSSMFLVVAVGSMAALFYQAVTGRLEARQQELRQRAEAALPPGKTTVLKDRVVLIKDEGVALGRTRVVYRGLSEGIIHIDVTLLDLDPSYAYPRHISKDDARKGIPIGARRYRLHAVNRKSLILLFAD